MEGVKKWTGERDSCWERTELSCSLAIDRGARPVVWPRYVPVLAQGNHGLNRKRRARLALANRLVLGVVRDVGRAVEYAVDAVAHVCPDDAAALGLCVLLNDVSKFPDQGSRLDNLDGLFQALPRRLDNTHRVGVRLGPVAHVVRLVEVSVVALVVQGDVEIDDIPIEENPLVGNAVADDFVDRCTE